MTDAQRGAQATQPVAAADVEPTDVSATVDGAEWDAYVSKAPRATRYHLWVWRSVFERVFGHETIYLAARRRGLIVGVLPLVAFRSVVFGRFLVSLPFVNYGGVVADDAVAVRALVAQAEREAASRDSASVELRHTERLCPDLAVKQHKVAMTLALSGDAESLWKGFDNKLRNQIRKAQKAGFESQSGGVELLEGFYAVFTRNMRDLGSPVPPRRLFEEVVATIPETRVYLVHLGGVCVAGGITIGYRDVVENPWASSLREYRPSNPNMLLYWNMISDSLALGYRTFDFGRSTPGEGTYQFKKQWGAVESPFYWEYLLASGAAPPDHNPKSGKFALAVSIWRHLPLAVTNVLGPRLLRNIP